MRAARPVPLRQDIAPTAIGVGVEDGEGEDRERRDLVQERQVEPHHGQQRCDADGRLAEDGKGQKPRPSARLRVAERAGLRQMK